MSEQKVVSASATVDAPAATVFELVADPRRQPEWDGNDNLQESSSPRVTRAGAVFLMTNTNGHTRENHVVEFTEGRRIAWRPSPMGEPQPGHLWRWEIEPTGDASCRVTHTYDWTELTDESRVPRARRTGPEQLAASIERLAALAEGR